MFCAIPLPHMGMWESRCCQVDKDVTRLLERDRGDAIPGLAAGVVNSPELKVLVAVREYARTVQRGDDGAGGRDAVRPEPTGDFGRVVRAFVLQRGDPGGRSAGLRAEVRR